MKNSKYRPLDDLEMVELLQAAYPEKFPDESDETWEAALEFVEEMSGFDDIAEFLGRVVTLTIPMKSPLSDSFNHCLGKVEISDGKATMTGAVHRRAFIPTKG